MTVGDFGQPFTIFVSGIDLTSTDTQAVTMRKPDGTKVSWSPLVVTSGSIVYTIASGDLDQSGTYVGEVVLTWGFLVDPPGQTTSSVFSFQVSPGL